MGELAGKNDDARSSGEELLCRGARSLGKQGTLLTVGALEAALCREFPPADAESWDRTGVLVGDPACALSRVAIALDPTVSAVRKAVEAGANVLVTHHPAFLTAPDAFLPAASPACASGAVVWEAVRAGVALMCFHTALDVSPRAARVLPGMLGLDFTGRVAEPVSPSSDKGYGQICAVPHGEGAPDTLGRLAARCLSVFGRPPRVWGDLDGSVRTVVTATGSAGGIGRLCLREAADCLVCGEIKYHEALDLSEAGLAIIELGHDVSELPLTAVLADAVTCAGVDRGDVVVIDQSGNWTCPEAVRL